MSVTKYQTIYASHTLLFTLFVQKTLFHFGHNKVKSEQSGDQMATNTTYV